MRALPRLAKASLKMLTEEITAEGARDERSLCFIGSSIRVVQESRPALEREIRVRMSLCNKVPLAWTVKLTASVLLHGAGIVAPEGQTLTLPKLTA